MHISDHDKPHVRGAMTIPNIVAFLTASTPWSSAAVMGAALASRYGSVLTGCYVDPMLRDFSVLDVESTMHALERDDVPFSTPDAADFMLFADQNGVAKTNWAAVQADVEGVITAARRLAR